MPPNIDTYNVWSDSGRAKARARARERESERKRESECAKESVCERKEINRANMRGRNERVRMCRMAYKEKKRVRKRVRVKKK